MSAAERRGLSLLHPPERDHLWLPQKYGGRAPHARVHRSRPLVPAGPGHLESVVDMLAHVAACLPRIEALIVWESALNRRLVTPGVLERTRWAGPAPRKLARVASSLSDSLLETITVHGLAAAGIAARQQVRLFGHRVDALIGARLVVQLDGYEFHSSPEDRRRDLEHDARLQLSGYTVLRFDYAHVVGDWPWVLDQIRAGIAVNGS